MEELNERARNKISYAVERLYDECFCSGILQDEDYSDANMLLNIASGFFLHVAVNLVPKEMKDMFIARTIECINAGYELSEKRDDK